jgi:hypothetical protein
MLSVPGVIISISIWGGKLFSFWSAGFLFLVSVVFGYVVEYRLGI